MLVLVAIESKSPYTEMLKDNCYIPVHLRARGTFFEVGVLKKLERSERSERSVNRRGVQAPGGVHGQRP